MPMPIASLKFMLVPIKAGQISMQYAAKYAYAVCKLKCGAAEGGECQGVMIEILSVRVCPRTKDVFHARAMLDARERCELGPWCSAGAGAGCSGAVGTLSGDTMTGP